MSKLTVVSTIALAAALASPLSAQQHQHDAAAGEEGAPMMQGMGAMMSGMMETAHPQPAMLLGMAQDLGLTSQQVEDLEGLKESAKLAHQTYMKSAMAAHAGARSALEGAQVDREDYASAMHEAAAQMSNAHVAMTNASLDAKALLTDEQRARLGAATSMMSMMQGAMNQETMGAMCAAMMERGGTM